MTSTSHVEGNVQRATSLSSCDISRRKDRECHFPLASPTSPAHVFAIKAELQLAIALSWSYGSFSNSPEVSHPVFLKVQRVLPLHVRKCKKTKVFCTSWAAAGFFSGSVSLSASLFAVGKLWPFIAPPDPCGLSGWGLRHPSMPENPKYGANVQPYTYGVLYICSNMQLCW